MSCRAGESGGRPRAVQSDHGHPSPKATRAWRELEALLQGFAGYRVPLQTGTTGEVWIIYREHCRDTGQPHQKVTHSRAPYLASQRVASDLLRSVHLLEALRDMFEYKDDKGKDQVRHKRGRFSTLARIFTGNCSKSMPSWLLNPLDAHPSHGLVYPLPHHGPSCRQGVNVRTRAQEIVKLINSPQKLQEEREKVMNVRGEISLGSCSVGGFHISDTSTRAFIPSWHERVNEIIMLS